MTAAGEEVVVRLGAPRQDTEAKKPMIDRLHLDDAKRDSYGCVGG